MKNKKTVRTIMFFRQVGLILILCFMLLSLSGIKFKYGGDESQIRSSSLQIIVEEGMDSITETFIDADGKVTYAADKRYAIVTKKHYDNILLEQFFDEKGNPAEQLTGHYAVRHEYDYKGREVRRMYLGVDGQLVMLTSGYAVISCTYDNQNRVETDIYIDISGNPVCTKSSGYGRRYEYNDDNRIVKITCLDQYGKPEKTETGYTIIKRTYYDDNENSGRIENEFYYDADGNPVTLSFGQYGLRREYDQFGRATVLTYLDQDGKAIVTEQGFSTIKRTFYEDDTVNTDMYLDGNGNPIALSHGQYGVKNIDGQKVYLDINGKGFFELSNYLHYHPIIVAVTALCMTFVLALCGKKINIILLIVYTGFILYTTLMYRTKGDNRIELGLFYSYRQFFSMSFFRLEVLNNIWLFLPLGTILYKIKPTWKILLVPLFFSASIELMQYITGFGMCEFDDIFSNFMGSIFGFEIGYQFLNLYNVENCRILKMWSKIDKDKEIV